MKKIIIALGLAIIAIANLQAQDTMYIYRKTNPLLKVSVSDIDSVIFYKPTVTGVTNQLTVTDIDGNVYNIVTIGGQAWMKENLKVTKYKDGGAIPLVTATGAWVALTTPGYSFYNNSVTGGVYGAMYNWYTVNTGKLCPTGWHVPSTTEWTTLTTFLGGETVAGGKLKATGFTYWVSPNIGANNETGFTALPGGYRGNNGMFGSIGIYGYWWSSTEYSTASSWYRYINYYSNVLSDYLSKQLGFSVRCLRD